MSEGRSEVSKGVCKGGNERRKGAWEREKNRGSATSCAHTSLTVTKEMSFIHTTAVSKRTENDMSGGG